MYFIPLPLKIYIYLFFCDKLKLDMGTEAGVNIDMNVRYM
jgi:hypothetical protein